MKPDWKEAPEWANWLAQDSDGKWWHEYEPDYNRSTGYWVSEGQMDNAFPIYLVARETLEKRPKL